MLIWGDVLREHCPGQAERVYELVRGTYSVYVEGGCTLKSNNWAIHGMFLRNVTIEYKEARIKTAHMDIRSLLNETEAINIPKVINPLFPKLGPIANVRLGGENFVKPIRELSEHNSYLFYTIIPLTTLVILILVGISIMYFSGILKIKGVPLCCKGRAAMGKSQPEKQLELPMPSLLSQNMEHIELNEV